ncbi:MAG TPA: hypothetical protein VM733_11190 [Thermoanaerobaculia bacterium]|nr:hypothetical protein [Thermoanaerobaculia bacterium]
MIAFAFTLLLSTCPMHAQHMKAAQADGSAEHGQDVDHRHDTFGMPHTASTHAFRLFEDGGAIELRANASDDAATIDVIRKHLRSIVEEFDAADFKTPAFVHGYPPAGVETMARLRDDIRYEYQPLPAGGRIRMTTKSAEALAAIHDFLRFQVTEHRTKDGGKVERDE